MKKIIFLAFVLSMVLIVGCQYIAQEPVEETPEQGITYVDLGELIDESERIAIEEVVEEAIEEVAVEEEVIEEPSVEVMAEEIEPVVIQEPQKVKEIPTVKVTEGDVVSFPNLKATDPDGDKIIYTFSAPLNPQGEWKTEDGDAGEYSITITASDGISTVSQEIRVVVESFNKAPVLEKINDIVISEGQTLKLAPKALDPEGQTLTITYSKWMTSDTKVLDYNSAGEYVVRITVSDGLDEISQDVKITVQDVNRPPQFVSII